MRTRKAQFMELDIMIAIIILIAGIVLLKTFFIHSYDAPQIDRYSQDAVELLQRQHVRDLDPTFLTQLQTDLDSAGTGITLNPNETIARQITILLIEAPPTTYPQDFPDQLAEEAMRETIPAPYDYGIAIISNNQRYAIKPTTSTDTHSLSQSRALLTGLEVNSPVYGYTGSLYLSNARTTRSAYTYLGGFIGQGNITTHLYVPPNDELLTLYLEGDIHDDFTIAVNDKTCDSITVPANPNPYNTITSEELSHQCLTALQEGDNLISINFAGDDLSEHYIGGGFIRVDYLSETRTLSGTTKKHYLPAVDGIFNLFDAFTIPGKLESLAIRLHYDANNSDNKQTVFFTIGNQTVYTDSGSENPVTVELHDNDLKMLDYDDYTNKTVPIRFGFENVTAETFTGNAVDAVLITDLSGSMAWEIQGGNNDGVTRNCDDPKINDLDTRKISIAQCADKDFTSVILNYTGNRVALSSFGYKLIEEHSTDFTDNESYLRKKIDDFRLHGSTCIACGIKRAEEYAGGSLQRTVLIKKGGNWHYDNTHTDGSIPLDNEGNNWYGLDYNENEGNWEAGEAILGHSSPDWPVTTELGTGTQTKDPVVLPEPMADQGTPEIDFTHGMISTGNTYGQAGADDGWDSASGVFGTGGIFIDQGATNGNLLLSSNNDIGESSGAYGITATITQSQYDQLQTGARALISFEYQWDTQTGISSQDRAWIKARWTNPDGTQTYLGSNHDNETDPDDEIDSFTGLINLRQGRFTQDITSLITKPGVYYLEIGGKKSASRGWVGNWQFDNILIQIATAPTDHYYFRKTFTINNLEDMRVGILNVRADEEASVYLNGEYLMDVKDLRIPNYYWNEFGIRLDQERFRQGKNVIAVELTNPAGAAQFDLELAGLNDSTRKAMFVMSDGGANKEEDAPWDEQDHGGGHYRTKADDQAIYTACESYANYGMNVYSVAFGATDDISDDLESVDIITLSQIARCDNTSHYFAGNSSETLREIYLSVARSIISLGSYNSQVISLTGTKESRIFEDSYIEYHYSGIDSPPGKLLINGQMEPFEVPDACHSIPINFPYALEPQYGSVVSYSANHWTDQLIINDKTLYNLSRYGSDYQLLGDPFSLGIGQGILYKGPNTITVRTADRPDNETGCSPFNKLLYTAAINSSFSLNEVYPEAEGCIWTVEFPTATRTIPLPSDYTGTNTCHYTSESIDYNGQTDWSANTDAWQQLGYLFFSSFDIEPSGGDGILEIDFSENELEMSIEEQTQIPYLWGPAILEVSVWR